MENGIHTPHESVMDGQTSISQNGGPSFEMLGDDMLRNGYLNDDKQDLKALNDSGGILSLIFLLARDVDTSDNPVIQSESLNRVLRMSEAHAYFRRTFLEMDGYAMINEVLRSSKCTPSSHLFHAYLKNCLNPSIRDLKSYESAQIQSATGFHNFFKCWRTWLKIPGYPGLLYSTTVQLLNPGNKWHEYNLDQMRSSNILKEVCQMLEVSFLQREDGHLQLLQDKKDIKHLTRSIQLMIGSPVDLKSLQQLVSCLLLLHSTSSAYVTQAKSLFYFLVPHDKNHINRRRFRQSSDSRMSSSTVTSSDDWKIIRSETEMVHDASHNNVLSHLMLGLRNILSDMPSQLVSKVLGPIIKMDHLIIWINNSNDGVRLSVLKTLLTCLTRVEAKDFIQEFVDRQGFQLISCQLRQFKPSHEAFVCFVSFILDVRRADVDFDEWKITRNWSLLKNIQASVFPCLLSHASNVYNTNHNESIPDPSTLKILDKIIRDIPASSPVLKSLEDNGITECLANILMNRPPDADSISSNGSSPRAADSNDLVFNDILNLLYTFSQKLFNSTGGIFFESYSQIIDYFDDLYSRCNPSFKWKYRECLVTVLQAGLDSIRQIGLDESFETRNSSFQASGVLNSFLISLNEKPLVSDLFADLGWGFGSSFSTSNHINNGGLNRMTRVTLGYSEISNRMQYLISRGIEVIIYRDSPILLDSEKFLARSFFHMMMDYLKMMFEKKKERSSWTKILTHMKKFLRLKISVLVTFMLSPQNSMDERLKFILWVSDNIFLEAKFWLHRNYHNVIIEFMNEMTGNMQDIQLQKIQVVFPGITREQLVRKKDADGWEKNWIKSKDLYLQDLRNRSEASQINLKRLQEKITSNAVQITSGYVEVQNTERSKYFSQLKQDSTHKYLMQKKWQKLIKIFTHEKNRYHDPKYFAESWELDPTEGPNKIRRKLRRTHLDIHEKFFQKDFKHKSKSSSTSSDLPFSYLFEKTPAEIETSALIDYITTYERIKEMSICSLITPQTEFSGELLFSETSLCFVGKRRKSSGNNRSLTPDYEVISGTWKIEDIKDVEERRHQLRDNSLELFVENGTSHLLAFQSSKERDDAIAFLSERGIRNSSRTNDLTSVTQLWREKRITTFDYLMYLNKQSGRSFNDLMIYPVYPFVISDYESPQLDLTKSGSFRKFEKPMAIQKEQRETYYREQYRYLLSEYKRRLESGDTTLDPVSCPVYHYGSHYSNSGTVLHFLVRLPPFTQMFLLYQDNNFDIPDRTFHSMDIAWKLASGDSTTDFKELTPEFFYLPEFLLNFENFNFGARHNEKIVHHVNLPPWCKGDARLFVLINRQALESDYVRESIHEWIDLIWGFKQSGSAAIESVNVFHPATYYGLNIEDVEDSLKKNALITMVKTFGQMPKQLFKSSHPKSYMSQSSAPQSSASSKKNSSRKEVPPVLNEVIGLKWGHFVGSPSTPDPIIVYKGSSKHKRLKLICLETNDVIGTPAPSSLLVSYQTTPMSPMIDVPYVDSMALLFWNSVRGSVSIRDKSAEIFYPFDLINSELDSITTCATLASSELVFIGYSSGAVAVYSLPPPFYSKSYSSAVSPVCWFFGHSGPVTVINPYREFRVAVTGSTDGSVIIWDLNTLCYVRTLAEHHQDITMITMSKTLGDVASISDLPQDSGSRIIVTTINGQLIKDFVTQKEVTAVCYSSCPEGISINVLVTGHSDGSIQMWSSWDMSMIRIIEPDSKFIKPIISMCFSTDCGLLYCVNNEGSLRVWGKFNTPIIRNNPVTVFSA